MITAELFQTAEKASTKPSNTHTHTHTQKLAETIELNPNETRSISHSNWPTVQVQRRLFLSVCYHSSTATGFPAGFSSSFSDKIRASSGWGERRRPVDEQKKKAKKNKTKNKRGASFRINYQPYLEISVKAGENERTRTCEGGTGFQRGRCLPLANARARRVKSRRVISSPTRLFDAVSNKFIW